MDVRKLVEMARDADALIELDCAVGDTIVYDTQLLQIRSASQPISEQALLSTVGLSVERTFLQDPKYPIRLLVDIAIKALSPSINDPTTAVQAIDLCVPKIQILQIGGEGLCVPKSTIFTILVVKATREQGVT